MKHIKMPATMI